MKIAISVDTVGSRVYTALALLTHKPETEIQLTDISNRDSDFDWSAAQTISLPTDSSRKGQYRLCRYVSIDSRTSLIPTSRRKRNKSVLYCRVILGYIFFVRSFVRGRSRILINGIRRFHRNLSPKRLIMETTSRKMSLRKRRLRDATFVM